MAKATQATKRQSLCVTSQVMQKPVECFLAELEKEVDVRIHFFVRS